jgi:prepilin-type N-terminal cleavage/methylation domain-containing protein
MKNQIRRRAHGFTLIELLVVISIIAVLAAAGFAAGNAAIQKARKTTALATATAIETAVNSFYAEYGSMPVDVSKVDTSDNTDMVKVLIGEGETANTRKVRFLSVKEAKGGTTGKRDGLNYTTFKLFDPWGNGFEVFLDNEYKERLSVSFGGKSTVLNGRRVAVASIGNDKKAGTADDVKTWGQ